MIFNFKSRQRIERKIGFRILTIIIAAIFISSITVTSLAVANAYERYYIVDSNGAHKRVSSGSHDANEIVEQAGFVLAEGDELDLSGYNEGEGGVIRILREDSLKNKISQRKEKAQETVEENKSKIRSAIDNVKNFLSGDFTVDVSVDGKSQKISVTEGETVKEALAKSDIKIVDTDDITPSRYSVLKKSDKIRITRVRYKFVYVDLPIEYTVKSIDDPEMTVGTRQVITKGENGEKNVLMKQRFENGKLVESKALKEKVTKEPVQEVVKVGTAPVEKLSDYAGTKNPMSELSVPSKVKLDKNSRPTSYKSKTKAKATAYTGDPETASGRTPMQGHIAVDPGEYPYGTELYIVSADGKYVYGYCVAADTGGFVQMGNTDVDLYMNNEDMCYDWGNRDIIIYVL